jgi:uncharacterized membrane protein YfcA
MQDEISTLLTATYKAQSHLMDIDIILILIGVLAGMVESTAGGSGLIVVPTLLALGIPPAAAMATSKLQYTFGAITSITRFNKAGLVEWHNIWPMVIASAGASVLGAWLLLNTRPDILFLVIPILLIASAVYFIFSPRLGDTPSTPRIGRTLFIITVIPVIGFYDGFFGVGSGSFLVLAMVAVLGMAARHATANTKVIDFASSTAALVILMSFGHVLWRQGLMLGIGQIVGAWIGAGLVIKRGTQFIRPLLAVTSICLSLKLAYDHWPQITALLQ